MSKPSRFRFAFTLALTLGGVLAAESASAASLTLDSTTCKTDLGGTWILPGPFCTVTGLFLTSGDTLTVPSLVHLVVDGAGINRGDIEVAAGGYMAVQTGDSLENHGAITNYGQFDNYGDIENRDDGGIGNQANLYTEGTITNLGASSYLSNFRGLINNYGVISNQASGAVISNATVSFLKNRGGVIEILAGELRNVDMGTVTNVNGALLWIADGAAFSNIGPDSLLLNRANGEVVNDGEFLNTLGGLVDNHGQFDNDSSFINMADADVTNYDDGTFDNAGLFENRDSGYLQNFGTFATPGSLKNYCLAELVNDFGGLLTGAWDNYDGAIWNFGTWNPGPTAHACVHK